MMMLSKCPIRRGVRSLVGDRKGRASIVTRLYGMGLLRFREEAIAFRTCCHEHRSVGPIGLGYLPLRVGVVGLLPLEP